MAFITLVQRNGTKIIINASAIASLERGGYHGEEWTTVELITSGTNYYVKETPAEILAALATVVG